MTTPPHPLRTARLAVPLTQSALAIKSGIAVNTVAAAEQGARLKLQSWLAIAAGLGMKERTAGVWARRMLKRSMEAQA